MRVNKNFMLCALVISLMVGVPGMESYAAKNSVDFEDEQESLEITKIKLEVDVQYSSDESVPYISVDTTDSRFYVTDFEILNDTGEWTKYTSPRIRVYLEAQDGYSFDKPTSKNVTLTSNAEFASGKLDSDSFGDTSAEVVIRVQPKNKGIGEPYNASWSGTKANWSPAYKATKYEVILLKGDEVVDTQSVDGLSYDFAEAISANGDTNYRFKVKAVNKSTSSPYVESDSKNKSEAGGWKQDASGWWYDKGNGEYPMNKWENIGNVWYYFNESGYMRTGWLNVDNKWYYLEENGAMTIGYKELSGKTYYFMEGSGEMVTNTSIGENTFNSDGELIGKRK